MLPMSLLRSVSLRDHGLAVAVRSGGHNVAGYAVCDGGVMIDMTLMNGVRVSPALDRAFVEGGALWLDVDAATTPFDRATPGRPDICNRALRVSPCQAASAGSGAGTAWPATISWAPTW